jgi:hypothetical protein
VAEQVTGLPLLSGRGGSAMDVPRIQPHRIGAGATFGSAKLPSIELPSGGGQPLAPSTRLFMEPRFGVDFSNVRLHNDSSAQRSATQIRARAFTYQNDIYLGRGESEQDQRLLAHELTHVVQQRGGGPEAPKTGMVAAGSMGQTVQRAISPELDKIESYLSYGIFDWAITDEEAIMALQLLESRPRFEQSVFFADPKYVNRLRENLPDDRVAELDSLQTNVAGITPPASTVEDIRSKLSYGLFDWVITDKEAVDSLEMLKQLKGGQLAAALASIDYGRLMDNLPENRRPELIDLLAQGLGTGGVKQTDEQQHPGTLLNSLTFRSDYGTTHGVIKDEKDSWNASGKFYDKPEWFVSGEKVVSNPIAQQKNTNLQVELGLNILPANAPSAPIRLWGRSSESTLNFDFAGTMAGGMNQKVTLTSSAALPDKVTALQDKYITWTMQWRDWKRDIGRTGAHTIFVTMNAPFVPEEVTYKRMSTAVSLVGAIPTTDPHPLVTGIMSRWGNYNLDVQLSNEWTLADNLDVGAQCIDIVRFVRALLQTVGCPGTTDAMIIWAQPGSPRTPEENLYPHPGGYYVRNPAQPTWGLGLIDANGCPNNFEAALRFDYSGLRRYYPGGVPMNRLYLTPTDVLFIFQCLAWIQSAGGKDWDIQQILTTYPDGSCSTGRIRCH